MKTYVAYYRVSTQKQGTSGLGLEGQKAAVKAFLKCENCVVGEFTEVESGKKNNRPELEKAIAHAKATKSTLVIAKLDRLSRNAGFIFALRDSGVDFICADMPDANKLTVGIFALLAENERDLISTRTKAALAAKKAQGHTLGNPDNLNDEARRKGTETIKLRALDSTQNKQATNFILTEKGNGFTFQQIAEMLNGLGYLTVTGKKYAAGTVHLLYKRATGPVKKKKKVNVPLRVRAMNKQIFQKEGKIKFKKGEKDRSEATNYTSPLFEKEIAKEGVVLDMQEGICTLSRHYSSGFKEVLAQGPTFIHVLYYLAYHYQKETEEAKALKPIPATPATTTPVAPAPAPEPAGESKPLEFEEIGGVTFLKGTKFVISKIM